MGVLKENYYKVPLNPEKEGVPGKKQNLILLENAGIYSEFFLAGNSWPLTVMA